MSVKHHKWYVSTSSVQSLKNSNKFACLDSRGKYHSVKLTVARVVKFSAAIYTQR